MTKGPKRPRDERRSPSGGYPNELLLVAILVLDKLTDLYHRAGHS
jgi:hypothetical protein